MGFTDLGKQIRAVRGAQGMSLRQLSRETRIHHSHLCRIEQGKANPSLGTLRAIGVALGVEPADLIADEPVLSHDDA